MRSTHDLVEVAEEPGGRRRQLLGERAVHEALLGQRHVAGAHRDRAVALGLLPVLGER